MTEPNEGVREAAAPPMATLAPPTPAAPSAPRPRAAAEWGLASLLLAGLLLLMGPLLLIAFAASVTAWPYGRLVGFLMFLGGELCTGPLCLVALLAGVLGIRAARGERGPAPLAVCGILTALVAGLLWLFVTIHVIGTLVYMFRR
jgi:hypothetical protein